MSALGRSEIHLGESTTGPFGGGGGSDWNDSGEVFRRVEGDKRSQNKYTYSVEQQLQQLEPTCLFTRLEESRLL